jgi:hypothetical protein
VNFYTSETDESLYFFTPLLDILKTVLVKVSKNEVLLSKYVNKYVISEERDPSISRQAVYTENFLGRTALKRIYDLVQIIKGRPTLPQASRPAEITSQCNGSTRNATEKENTHTHTHTHTHSLSRTSCAKFQVVIMNNCDSKCCINVRPLINRYTVRVLSRVFMNVAEMFLHYVLVFILYK